MSNSYHYAGRLSSAPTLTHYGDKAVCKFTLIRNEYAGKDESGKRLERRVAIQFTAFRHLAEAIAKNVMEGDQLVLRARLENNNFTDEAGVEQFKYNFIVEEFDFGAPGPKKREQFSRPQGGSLF